MTDIDVSVDYLRRSELPGICAVTGEPTSHSYGRTIYRNQVWIWVFLLVGLIPGLILRYLTADPVNVGVPISRRLAYQRRLCGWPTVLVGLFVAGWLIGWDTGDPGWVMAAVLSVATFVAMVVGYNRANVSIKRDGDVVWMRVHPALAEVVGAESRFFRPPMPSWHPDPSGAPQYRWWDGTRWTDEVKAYAGG